MTVDVRTEGYAQAILQIARAEDQLDVIEAELFQVARAVESSPELTDSLSDRRVSVDRRISIVEDLIEGKASRLTLSLVSFLVTAERIRQLPDIADEFVAKAAASRQKAVADVRSAMPLDDETLERLRVGLNRATGKDVEIKLVVDPTLVGGIIARVGDIVIDGSIRSRLEGLRDALQVR